MKSLYSQLKIIIMVALSMRFSEIQLKLFFKELILLKYLENWYFTMSSSHILPLLLFLLANKENFWSLLLPPPVMRNLFYSGLNQPAHQLS